MLIQVSPSMSGIVWNELIGITWVSSFRQYYRRLTGATSGDVCYFLCYYRPHVNNMFFSYIVSSISGYVRSQPSMSSGEFYVNS